MKIAIINRGVVGSGKSTFASELQKQASEKGLTCNVHNTDQYFMEDGEYKFDFTKLGYNHKQNLNAFIESLKQGVDIVVCDNTNTTPKEYRKYINEAKSAGYDVMGVVFIPDKWEVHNERNTHNVPEDVIGAMIHRLNNNLVTEGADYDFEFKPNSQGKKFEDRISYLAKQVIEQ